MTRPDQTLARRHRMVAFACAAFVLVMVGAAYAAVPLYDLFCRATGFGGRPVVATVAPRRLVDRRFEIRFDANVNGGLPWRFNPEQAAVTVQAGEVKTIYYRVTNLGDQETRAVASYNVMPSTSAPFFSKIQCFCFSEQSLAPGQSLDLPVVFFVDPAIIDAPELDDVATITLSYTFFAAKRPAPPVAAAGEDKRKL